MRRAEIPNHIRGNIASVIDPKIVPIAQMSNTSGNKATVRQNNLPNLLPVGTVEPGPSNNIGINIAGTNAAKNKKI